VEQTPGVELNVCGYSQYSVLAVTDQSEIRVLVLLENRSAWEETVWRLERRVENRQEWRVWLPWPCSTAKRRRRHLVASFALLPQDEGLASAVVMNQVGLLTHLAYGPWIEKRWLLHHYAFVNAKVYRCSVINCVDLRFWVKYANLRWSLLEWCIFASQDVCIAGVNL